MSASTRSVHLVGTIPAASAEAALAFANEVLGDSLGPAVPDGETGDRLDWVNRLVQNLRTNPQLELASDGDFSSYENTPAFKVRKGAKFTAVDLDYFDEFTASWPAFQEFQSTRPDVSFQIGLPGHIDLSFISFGFNLPRGLRNLRPFRKASVEEIERVSGVAGDAVVYQLEVPIELILLTKLPAVLRPLATRFLAREALKLVEDAPEGTRFGLHLCYGDLNHESMGDPKDAGPLVRFSNALVKRWPAGKPLEFIHAPFALGKLPPVLDRSHYEPLADIDLPEGARFIAGFIHEGRTVEELIGIRDTIEGIMGHTVDVAASCGLGRRDEARARRNLELSREVAEA
jgi:hypothetical protein